MIRFKTFLVIGLLTTLASFAQATLPLGSHDSSDCSMSRGWSCDSDNFNASLEMHFYADGPAGTGTYLGNAVANRQRLNGLGGQCGVAAGSPTYHDFEFPTPASLKNGQPHTIYAHAINVGPAEGNPVINYSPKTITCAAGTLSVGSGSALPGNTVTIPVSLSMTTPAASAMQFTLILPAGITTVSVTPGSALTSAGKSITTSVSGSSWTFIIFGTNSNLIGSGSIASLTLRVNSSTSPGTRSLPLFNMAFSNANGQTITGITGTGGTITVQSPPPPPPTSTGCDTNSNGTVDVIDVQRSINQTLLLETCTANINQTGTCEVADTQRVINAALGNPCVTGPLSSVAASGRISSASRSGARGTIVTLPITLSGSVPVATGMQFTLTLPAGISTSSITPQAALTSTGKTVSAVRVGSSWRFAITGMNQTVIPAGNLVYLNLQVNLAASTGTFSVPFSNIVYTNGSGRIVTGLTDGAGSITILPSTTPPPPPPPSNLPTLSVGSTTGQAGTVVALPITFSPWSASISNLQFSIKLPPGISTSSVTPGTILTNAGKSISTSVSGSTWTFVIFGLNSNSIGSGTLLNAIVRIAPGTAAGTRTVPIFGVVFANPNGSTVNGTSTGGTIIVQAPPPPPTSTGCDTNSNGTVDVIDVQRSINQTLLLETCTANINQTGTCEVADTQRVINAALGNPCVTGPLSSVAASGRISSASRSGARGTIITLPITLSGSVPVATGMQFTLTLPAGISTISITPQAALTSTGKSVSAVRVGSSWRFAITGMNQTVIPAGNLAYLNLRINLSASTGTFSVPFSNIVYTNSSGRIVTGLTDGAGSITVLLPPPPPPPPPTSPATVITNAATELSAIRVYPSPWRSDMHSGHPVTFSGLTADATVKIFTVSGRWVKTVSAVNDQATWDLTNDSGDTVASGLYIYLVTDPQGNKTRGKFSVIR